jgi:hypothetical protein
VAASGEGRQIVPPYWEGDRFYDDPQHWVRSIAVVYRRDVAPARFERFDPASFERLFGPRFAAFAVTLTGVRVYTHRSLALDFTPALPPDQAERMVEEVRHADPSVSAADADGPRHVLLN